MVVRIHSTAPIFSNRNNPHNPLFLYRGRRRNWNSRGSSGLWGNSRAPSLPNILPYEVGTPAAFGFAEWNGRSLTDNAPNVMFSMAANTPVNLGIGKESVTSKPSKTFPYILAAGESRTAGA